MASNLIHHNTLSIIKLCLYCCATYFSKCNIKYGSTCTLTLTSEIFRFVRNHAFITGLQKATPVTGKHVIISEA